MKVQLMHLEGLRSDAFLITKVTIGLIRFLICNDGFNISFWQLFIKAITSNDGIVFFQHTIIEVCADMLLKVSVQFVMSFAKIALEFPHDYFLRWRHLT